MKRIFALATAGTLLLATAATAQDMQEGPPAPNSIPPAQTEPMEPRDIPPSMAPPAVSAEFTDEQIAAFANAALQMRDLNADGALSDEERQTQAEAIVADAGLDTATYTAIGRAAQSDPAVAQRIQMAISALNEGDMADEAMQDEPDM
ncbi:DUF4168 domain-containing protein [Aurantiacibacter aquimixticola]|uniref:DUF4168 domain-containing protein n=1 Tax=Aurantiacibacter aquimixticola TaxID=1958945 RepID=A0A419RU63_9SPHN|nr:DUF4168 domain-containing protein [Aurantiacibacter aquimixticola]RJY09326.1 DUF4168 domain-containing protein [Aurantiacibacter aquimixticola]